MARSGLVVAYETCLKEAFVICILARALVFSLFLFMPSSISAAECLPAALPTQPSAKVIAVDNVGALYRAVRAAKPGSVVLLAPGNTDFRRPCR